MSVYLFGFFGFFFSPKMFSFYSFFLEVMLFYLFPTGKHKSMISQESNGNFKRYI